MRRRAVFYAVLHLTSGVLLHPVLKVFYKQENTNPATGQAEKNFYGDVKNSVSVFDMGLAAVFLALLRGLSRCCKSAPLAPSRTVPSSFQPEIVAPPMSSLFSLTFLPGVCIFLSVAVATLANYESFFLFMISAPLEIVFVFVMVWAFRLDEERRGGPPRTTPSWDHHSRKPTRAQLGCAALIILGSICVTADHVSRSSAQSHSGTGPPAGWTIAVLLCVGFRLNQAVTSIVVRRAYVRARELRRSTGVVISGPESSSSSFLDSSAANDSPTQSFLQDLAVDRVPHSIDGQILEEMVSTTVDVEQEDVTTNSVVGAAGATNKSSQQANASNFIVGRREHEQVGAISSDSVVGQNGGGFWFLVLDLALCKLCWVTLFLLPYALATEGFIPPWRKLWPVLTRLSSSSDERTVPGANATVLLYASMGLTLVFQSAQIGLLSSVRVVPAVAIMQLQPVLQVLIVVALALAGGARGSDPSSLIHLLAGGGGVSWWMATGCVLLLSGAVGMRWAMGK